MAASGRFVRAPSSREAAGGGMAGGDKGRSAPRADRIRPGEGCRDVDDGADEHDPPRTSGRRTCHPALHNNARRVERGKRRVSGQRPAEQVRHGEHERRDDQRGEEGRASLVFQESGSNPRHDAHQKETEHDLLHDGDRDHPCPGQGFREKMLVEHRPDGLIRRCQCDIRAEICRADPNAGQECQDSQLGTSSVVPFRDCPATRGCERPEDDERQTDQPAPNQGLEPNPLGFEEREREEEQNPCRSDCHRIEAGGPTDDQARHRAFFHLGHGVRGNSEFEVGAGFVVETDIEPSGRSPRCRPQRQSTGRRRGRGRDRRTPGADP